MHLEEVLQRGKLFFQVKTGFPKLQYDSKLFQDRLA